MYCKFLAYRQHFNTDYDAVKYNGKVNVKETTFQTRKDRWQWLGLSRQHKDLKQFLISLFLHDKKAWLNTCKSLKVKRFHEARMYRVQNLETLFSEEMTNVVRNMSSPQELVEFREEYPYYVQLFLENIISIEVFIILDSLFKFDHSRIEDVLLWPSEYERINNYKPFVHFDRQKYGKLLMEICTKYMSVK